MALSRFPKAMDDAANAVIQLTKAARYVRDSSGDLRLRDLDRIQEALRAAKLAATEVITEGQKSPANAEAFMASMGGPTSLQAFGAAMVDLETKASAWNDALAVWVGGLSAANFAEVATVSREGTDTRHILRVDMCDGLTATPLRESTELADLIAALEAVGG